MQAGSIVNENNKTKNRMLNDMLNEKCFIKIDSDIGEKISRFFSRLFKNEKCLKDLIFSALLYVFVMQNAFSGCV